MKKSVVLFLWIFKSVSSLHTLKLAWNKSMRASDDEQGY